MSPPGRPGVPLSRSLWAPLAHGLTPGSAASKWGLVAERLLDLASGFSDVLARVQVLLRRLLELHVFKLVALYTVWVALKEVRTGWTPPLWSTVWGPPWGCCRARPSLPAVSQVSVMNLLLVVLWAFALPYPRFRPMASCLCTVWTCVIIVCKMLYQLKVVSPHEYSSNCSEVRLQHAPTSRAYGPHGDSP